MERERRERAGGASDTLLFLSLSPPFRSHGSCVARKTVLLLSCSFL
jgi:hypothetical protein